MMLFNYLAAKSKGIQRLVIYRAGYALAELARGIGGLQLPFDLTKREREVVRGNKSLSRTELPSSDSTFIYR
jgi:uncharacterized membrane protein YciS (DUF1049 family)